MAGGWPEAWYRVTGTSYRAFYIIMSNRRIQPFLKKDSELKVGSAARASIQITKEKTGDYGVPTEGDEIFDNPHGAPSSIHNWDDFRPIPIFGREPDAIKADGSMVPKAKIDSFLIHKAYENDMLERRHKLTVKSSKVKWGIFGFLIALTLIFEFAVLYEVILYGVNMNCALHTKACP